MGEIAPEGQPVEGEPVVEEAPWTGPSQEDWAATQEALQTLTPLAQQWMEWQSQPDEGEAAGDDFDPFDRESVRAMMREEMAPFANYTREQQLAAAEEEARDMINDMALRDGEFLIPEESAKVAFTLANQLAHETRRQYGDTPKAAEEAIKKAVAHVREWEQAVGKAYHDRQVNQLSTLGQARREPSAAGTAGADQLVTPEGGDEMALVRSFFPAARG